MRTLVVVPTYEEVANIDELLDRVHAAAPDVDVLVVDDNSPDGTGDLVEARAGGAPWLHLLRRPGKAGLGAAYRAGFEWGADRGYEVMVEMDADLSHDPAALPSLLAAVASGADLAIGSRYVPGGSIPDWAWHRRSLSRWANRYASFMLSLPVADTTAGYRAYRTTMLAAIDVPTVQAAGYGFQIEMTQRVAHAGGAIVEVPIAFTDRTRGKSKMSRDIVIEAMVLVTRWGIERRLGRRP